MSASSAKYRALKQISSLLCSNGELGDPISLALELARKTLEAQGAALFCIEDQNSRPTVYTSVRGDQQHISHTSEQLVMAAFQGRSVKKAPGIGLALATSPDGVSTALVCEGLKEPDDGFLQAVLDQMMVFLALDRERNKSAESRNRADKRLAEVSTIYEIGQATHEVGLDGLLDMVTAKAAAVMEAQACSLMLSEDGKDELVIRASFGLSEDIVKGARIAYGEGVAGKVAQTGEPMLLLDLDADPRFAEGEVIARTDIASSLLVPLKDRNGRVHGVISIRRHKPSEPFTETDLQLLCIFASQAAHAILNAQLHARLQQQIEEMHTVSELVRAMNSTLDLNTVLSMIADSIVGVVGFDRCCVYLLDPRANELVAGIRRGYDTANVEERIKIGEGLVGVAAKEQIPVFDEGPASVPPMLAVPMVVRGACIGAVLADNHVSRRPMPQEGVDLLSTFANQAGIAVENARLYEAMEEKYAELNMLFDHSRFIGAAYGLDRVSEMVMEAASRATHADGGLLLLLNERSSELLVKVSVGSCSNAREKVEALASEREAVEAVRRMRGPVIITDPEGQDLKCFRLLRPVMPASGSLLMLPMVAENAVVGTLVVVKDNEEFESSAVKLISIVTSHAAAVLKNAINYEHRMQRKELELTALHEFSERISSASSLGEALDSILAIVGNVVECDESRVYAIDQEKGVLIPKAVRRVGGVPNQLPEEPLEGNDVTSWAIRERKALVSPDIDADPRFDQSDFDGNPIRSLMAIPLMVQEEVVAVLSVHSYRPNLYSEDDVRVLSIIASQGAAIYKELEALSALTNYTDNVLSSIAAGVVTLDSEGIVLTWNKAATQIIAYEPSEVVGVPFHDVVNRFDVPEAERASLIAAIREVFSTGQLFQAYKLGFHPYDRDEMYMNISISPLMNSTGEQLGLVIIFEDVTREIQMENEFRKMGELAAVGQLAASIAHELRNPLASIKGAAQLLREQYDDEMTITEFLDIILEEVDSLSNLTSEFLDFARPIQLDLRPLCMNNIVLKTLQLMALQINDSRVTVDENLAEELPLIHADEKQIEQVLRNVILNALQAMPSGGSIRITTAPHIGRAGGVELTVTDTGMGIPAEKLDRIFVPFFTTKTKGTGLGLSVVQRIVENHGGRIQVASEEEDGATFNLTFPERPASPLTESENNLEERRD